MAFLPRGIMSLSLEISRKGEASGKPIHPLKTYPSRMLRPSAGLGWHNPPFLCHIDRSRWIYWKKIDK